jgi:hypothetical protein
MNTTECTHGDHCHTAYTRAKGMCRLSDWVRLVLLAAVKERLDEPELINAADKAVVR